MQALTRPCDIEVFYDGACPLCMREIRRGPCERELVQVVVVRELRLRSTLGDAFTHYVCRHHFRMRRHLRVTQRLGLPGCSSGKCSAPG